MLPAMARLAASDRSEACGHPPAVGALLSQVGRSVSKGFHEALAPLDLEPRQYLLLGRVAAAEGCSQQAVGGSLQIPPSRMVGLVDALQERGLIRRVPNPADRRAYGLRLTPAGHRLLAAAKPISEAFEAEICEPFSPVERDLLVELLGRVAERRQAARGAPPGRDRRGVGPA
jgi:DNA-binding MarR family transcriptional regulator